MVTTVVSTLAIWIAAAAAHETKGAGVRLLPVVFYAVLIAATFVLWLSVAGVGVTLSMLAWNSSASRSQRPDHNTPNPNGEDLPMTSVSMHSCCPS